MRFIPTGRKRGNKPLDKTSGRWLNLKEGEMDVERGSPKVSPGGYWQMPGPMRKTQDKSSDAGGSSVAAEGEKGIEMLKMKIEPAMCMKTNNTTTFCPSKNRYFSTTARD